MTYAPTKFQLTHLLQDVWFRLGQMKRWKVTGGSTTTIVNSAWAGVEEQIYEDDDPSLIYGTAVVIEDAAGANAAPEGEIARITDYDSTTFTLTIDALTQGVAVNDRVGIVSPLFPYEDMIEAANTALFKLGEIELVDTSLSIVSQQSEYALPAAIRTRPSRVRRATLQDAGNSAWVDVPTWDVIPAAPGSNWTLVLPEIEPGYSVEVRYIGVHPKLTAFDSNISDSIHPELAISALLAEAYQWYNNSVGGSNPYFLQRENKALQDLEAAKISFPIATYPGQVQGFPHWGKRGRYVPLTNDLRA